MTDAGADPPKSCLLVESAAVVRHMLAFALSRGVGLQVVEATDGFEALRRLAEQRFDLVVTALNLPLLDGSTLVGRIRQDPAHAEVPILAVIADADVDDLRRAVALGANGWVTRPVQSPQLVDAAKALLKIQGGRGNRSAP